MASAINKGHISLYVINDLNDKGINSCATTLKTYSYAERATNFGTKTWGNLIARIFDAISHMFCKQVEVRGSNAINGAWENHTYWVKGEAKNEAGSLASARFSSFSSQENPFSRPASGSAGSIDSLVSDPGSVGSTPNEETEELPSLTELNKAKVELSNIRKGANLARIFGDTSFDARLKEAEGKVSCAEKEHEKILKSIANLNRIFSVVN